MSEYRFLYWDDLGDSQDEVDNQKSSCANHQREVDDSEREEQEAIMRNGNSGEHYDIYDDGEKDDIEWAHEKQPPTKLGSTDQTLWFRWGNW